MMTQPNIIYFAKVTTIYCVYLRVKHTANPQYLTADEVRQIPIYAVISCDYNAGDFPYLPKSASIQIPELDAIVGSEQWKSWFNPDGAQVIGIDLSSLDYLPFYYANDFRLCGGAGLFFGETSNGAIEEFISRMSKMMKDAGYSVTVTREQTWVAA